jgi:hypothetical protein
MGDVADEHVVRLATGHASAFMHRHYSSHATEEQLRQAAAAAKVFAGAVVPPRREWAS